MEPGRADRTVTVDADVDTTWAALVDIDRYPRRWPWLRMLEWRGQFRPGTRCRARVRSPFGYSVHVNIALVRVVPGHLVEARVTGDVVGTARVTLTPITGADDRTVVQLETSLRPERRLLRLLTRVVPPVARFGHDRIVRSGMARFAADV